jgi:hypothetical protein
MMRRRHAAHSAMSTMGDGYSCATPLPLAAIGSASRFLTYHHARRERRALAGRERGCLRSDALSGTNEADVARAAFGNEAKDGVNCSIVTSRATRSAVSTESNQQLAASSAAERFVILARIHQVVAETTWRQPLLNSC